MSNKVLKDANNQLINIDSSNLSSFSEGVVHTTGTETITGNKKIQDATLQFEYTDSIYQGYPINGSIRAGYLSQNSHDWPGLQFSYQDDYADSQAESYFTGVLSSYYTENNERLPALVWSTNYLDPDTEDYDDNFYVYHLPKGGTGASPKTLATTDDLAGKVSKTGDTMTGSLTLSNGTLAAGVLIVGARTASASSGYRLTISTDDGEEPPYFYVHNNTTGLGSIYLPPISGNTDKVLATTDDKAKIYAHKLIHDEIQYPGYYDIIVYTTKRGPFNISSNSDLKYLITGASASTYGTTIKAALEGSDGRQIPILNAYSSGGSTIRLAFIKTTSSSTTIETEVTSYNYFTNYASTDDWEVSLDLK